MKRMIVAGALIAVLGVAGVAHSAPGNGNGNGQGNGNSANAGSSPGNSGGNGVGNGNGLGKGLLEAGTRGNSTAALAKDDPLHPRNVGKFNGFLHASPRALANASEKSAIGLISKVYATVLDEYFLGGDVAKIDTMATLLEQVANKPLTEELVLAINDRIVTENLVENPSPTYDLIREELAAQILAAASLN